MHGLHVDGFRMLQKDWSQGKIPNIQQVISGADVRWTVQHELTASKFCASSCGVLPVFLKSSASSVLMSSFPVSIPLDSGLHGRIQDVS